jgi:hypothetical protein
MDVAPRYATRRQTPTPGLSQPEDARSGGPCGETAVPSSLTFPIYETAFLPLAIR